MSHLNNILLFSFYNKLFILIMHRKDKHGATEYVRAKCILYLYIMNVLCGCGSQLYFEINGAYMI